MFLEVNEKQLQGQNQLAYCDCPDSLIEIILV